MSMIALLHGALSTILGTTNLSVLSLPSWPIALLIGLAAVPIFIYFYCDYEAFIALGPGGTPQTISGYLRVKVLALVALRDPYSSKSLSTSENGYLNSLPDRGIRPVVKGIAPQRQITQIPNSELYQKLDFAITKLCTTEPDLKIDRSWFEKHNNALFTTKSSKRTWHGEICHAHPTDGSMHLTLHPADVQVVLQAKWGERHPLARGGAFESFVPQLFVVIYAPRDEEDIDTVVQIVKASIWHCNGNDISTVDTPLSSSDVTAESMN